MHVPDEARRGEGTSGVMRESEQSTEQVDVHEEVYGPWIVVERRKNSTKPLRSGGTLLRQGSGMNTEQLSTWKREVRTGLLGLMGLIESLKGRCLLRVLWIRPDLPLWSKASGRKVRPKPNKAQV